ncbi:sensor histidine kinase [Rhodanobacter sp. Col0626]|uniref:sensor histidine kinase n=1 Tax=Rhodanobacter sp. Col0626 TaxID=3415679 RepID=UPI003CF74154
MTWRRGRAVPTPAWLLFSMLYALLLMPALASASAPALRLSAHTPRLSLEGRLEHFADTTGTLPFEAIPRQSFVRLPGSRSLGYDTNAHWFRVALNPTADAPSQWVLAIGSPELEEVDVWVEQRTGDYRHYAMGYHRPFENRPVRTRLFAAPVEVFSGMHVYFRVHTTNAIVVHAELWQVQAFSAHETRSNFYRGMYFGLLLIVVMFYCILGARLREVVMAAYAGYIASQLLFHLGTNGYLPVLLTAHAAWFTDALPRIGWLGGAASIVLMWDRLLNLKQAHPRIHRLYLFTVLLNIGLLPFALAPALVGPWLLHVVTLANALNSLNFLISMVLLLRFWWRSRRGEFMVYFVAFVIPAAGASINSAMNLGVLSQNAVTSNFYQVAVLVHVLVMSYGLALRLRQLQYDKVAAQQESAVVTRRSEEQRRFVAMLSHEFGNPLAAIDRAAQMIQIKLQELPSPEAQRLAQIRSNAATLSGFVDNFLMTEALDRGTLALSLEPCVIRALLENAIRLQGDMAGERLLFSECPEEAAFDLDSTLIGVAVGNLLTNALRYSPPENPVAIGAMLDEEGLRIRVVDQGPGMSDDELDKLGTPYFRAASSLGKKGSGLGYHFTRRIVEAHGGTLTVCSPAGSGLEVEIFLPS